MNWNLTQIVEDRVYHSFFYRVIVQYTYWEANEDEKAGGESYVKAIKFNIKWYKYRINRTADNPTGGSNNCSTIIV